jgi:hypothetical protein
MFRLGLIKHPSHHRDAQDASLEPSPRWVARTGLTVLSPLLPETRPA